MYLVRSTCRSCEGADLEVIFSLGEMPLPGALLLPSQLEQVELRYPLDVAFCRGCSLVQLLQTISPSDLYDERFRYVSSTSEGYVEHLRAIAERLILERRLDGNSYVIEIGSNDGAMLKNFQARGASTLGIEPAPAPASEGRRAGIATLPTFFTRDLANQLAAEGRRADVIIANNVLCHVPDIHGFLFGIRALLKEDGVAILEVPYVRDLVEKGEFDTISHEHISYFSVTSLERLLASEDLTLREVEHHPVHGGSLRLFVSRNGERQASVREYLDAEVAAGVTDISFYADLARNAESTKFQLLAMLDEMKADGKSIVGYGAASKGSTMLNYCGVGDNYLDYIVDLNIYKQGRFMPGVHLPVLNPDRLVSNHPDYVLLLTWNNREEVLQQQEAYRRQGGRFIVPIPEPAII